MSGLLVRVARATAVSLLIAVPSASAGELYDAVRAQDLDAVKAALAAGADVDELVFEGTALHVAVGGGSAPIVEALLDGGASTEIPGEPAGSTPLHLAVQLNDAPLVQLLLERGAVANSRDSLEKTPLMLAGANNLRDVTRLLLEAGADVALSDGTYGETALHWAAFAGDDEVVRMLLDAGSQVDVKSTMTGQTPLFYAAHHGHLDIVELLISRGADPQIKDKHGASVLEWSISPATEYLQSLGVE